MANQETQILDGIIASRRAMLLGGGSLAALALAPRVASAAVPVSAYTDADILNFALNLEYLEANFYYLAAFGTTIDVANAATTAAGAKTYALNGLTNYGTAAGTAAVTGPGVVATSNPGGGRVPFTTLQVSSYAVETAIEEGKHVGLLRSALSTAAVAQPPIDVSNVAFQAAASAAGVAGATGFSPYASDAFFLLGAYIFEDVGVTAYHGAAPLITSPANLSAAGGILAVEAYHAGLIRTTLNNLDPTGALGLLTATQQISALRAKLALQITASAPNPDDFGVTSARTVNLSGNAATSATQIVDADANAIAFSRNTSQVLNIVTGGGAVGTTFAKGVFFPQGLNGLFR